MSHTPATGLHPKALTSPVVAPDDHSDEESDLETKWLPRTNIALKPFTTATRSFSIDKGPQNESIKTVIASAWRHGSLMMISNTKFCPVTVSGLHEIAREALLWAADDAGFDGEYDILDRMERGDESKYMLPLVKYVSV